MNACLAVVAFSVRKIRIVIGKKKMLRIILAKKDVENYFGRREKNLERTYSRKDG
jgi:hypothetical protein